jgi:DNA polymerase phi
MGPIPKKRQREAHEANAADDHGTKKRQRQYTEQDQKLAKIYSDLADERTNVRIRAAKDYVAEFAPEREPSGELIEKSLTRLIRGLCSGRKAARPGFFIALSELLRQFYHSEVSLSGVPELSKLIVKIDELTELDGSVDGPVSNVYYTTQAIPQSRTSPLSGVFYYTHTLSKYKSTNGYANDVTAHIHLC